MRQHSASGSRGAPDPYGTDLASLSIVQQGVVTLSQLREAGLSRSAIYWQLRSGRWQVMRRGVYATFSGEPPRPAILRAALLRAGTGAMLSHQTAAEVYGLVTSTGRIHITVPSQRRPGQDGTLQGVVIHRSYMSKAEELPAWELRRTSRVDTILDLASGAKTFDDAYAWISRAIGREFTTAAMLSDGLAARKRTRWHKLLLESLADVEEGIMFPLERRYVYGVERAHGLPKARRQARRRLSTCSRYLDNLYERYGLCVELDGDSSHPPEQKWQDARRDNDNLWRYDTQTFRFGMPDVSQFRCERAAQVATVLIRRGWAATTLKACGPTCAIHRMPNDDGQEPSPLR